MSQNKSTMTKCGKKTKVQGPQNGFCLFLNNIDLRIEKNKKVEIRMGLPCLEPFIVIHNSEYY